MRVLVETAIVLLTGAAILRGWCIQQLTQTTTTNPWHCSLMKASPAVAGVPSLVDTAHKVCHELDTCTPVNRARPRNRWSPMR